MFDHLIPDKPKTQIGITGFCMDTAFDALHCAIAARISIGLCAIQASVITFTDAPSFVAVAINMEHSREANWFILPIFREGKPWVLPDHLKLHIANEHLLQGQQEPWVAIPART